MRTASALRIMRSTTFVGRRDSALRITCARTRGKSQTQSHTHKLTHIHYIATRIDPIPHEDDKCKCVWPSCHSTITHILNTKRTSMCRRLRFTCSTQTYTLSHCRMCAHARKRTCDLRKLLGIQIWVCVIIESAFTQPVPDRVMRRVLMTCFQLYDTIITFHFAVYSFILTCTIIYSIL